MAEVSLAEIAVVSFCLLIVIINSQFDLIINSCHNLTTMNGDLDYKLSRRALLAADARRTTLIGIFANSILATVKAISGYLGNSYALIADAIESFSDVTSSIVVWIGLKIAASPPSEKHPYGKGRAETLAASIVSLALFAAAIGIAIQSVKEIRTPHHSPAYFTLIILILVVIVKEALFRKISKIGDTIGSNAVKTDALHHRSDALTSLAAFIGIAIALIGGEGYESADDWAALFASGIIAFNAWTLLAPALREILDSNPNKSLEDSIRKIAEQIVGVLGTHRCFIRKLGFDYFVDLDILVNGKISVKEGHNLAHQVQDLIRQEIPLITRVLIHVEPIDDYGRTPLFPQNR